MKSIRQHAPVVLLVAAVAGGFGLFLLGLVTLAEGTSDADRRAGEALQQYRLTHPDAVACRARGGFPVWSNWSDAFIDCRPMLPKGAQ